MVAKTEGGLSLFCKESIHGEKLSCPSVLKKKKKKKKKKKITDAYSSVRLLSFKDANAIGVNSWDCLSGWSCDLSPLT